MYRVPLCNSYKLFCYFLASLQWGKFTHFIEIQMMNYLVLFSLVPLSSVYLTLQHCILVLIYMLYLHAPCTWIQRLKIKNTDHKNSLLIYFETRSYLVWCRLYGCYHSLCGCYGDHLEENMAQILEGYQGGCWNSQKHLCKSKPDPCFVFPDSVGFRNQRSFFFIFYYLHTLASW